MGASRSSAPHGQAPAPITSVGRWHIDAKVGAGSMGVIYAGHAADGARVAIKLMRTGLGEAGRLRFDREVRLLAGLDHPAIVACHDHGFLPDGRPYLVMEWLAGDDLATRLRRGPLSIDETITLATRVASALAVVHARGVVHRDLKPSNIFLLAGAVTHTKLLDFGVAHADTTARVTAVGDMIGTLGYMAPEQARGEPDIDGRADLFSLACVLYECLAGQPAFPGGEPIAVLARLLIDDPPSLRSIRPEVPPALDRLIVDMLDKQAPGRPRSAQLVVDRLAALSGPSPSRDARVQVPITAAERRLFVVLFARLPEELGLAATLPAEHTTSSQLLAGFLALAHPFRVHFSPLLGGTLLLSSDSGGSAGDDAALLARRALALRAALPGITLAMAAGHGTRSQHALTGQVLDAAAAVLACTDLDTIGLDGVTADLLAERFIVDADHDLRLLSGERDTPQARTVLGRTTPFVGRSGELTQILECYAAVVADRRPAIVLITAEAGLGKTRLVHEALAAIHNEGHEFLAAIQGHRHDALATIHGQRPLVLAAPGAPIGETAALGAIARIIRRIPADSSDSPLSLAARITARVAGVLPDDEVNLVADALIALAGAPGDDGRAAAHVADAGRLAWLRWLEVECTQQPVILALDDLHCWDPPSLEFIVAALEQARTSPLLVLAAGRAEARDRSPRLWASPGAVHLDLAPLYARAGERLVREFLPHVAPDVVKSLALRSQGNAYFLEELIRAAVAGDARETPPSVLATVQARLGRLGESDRRLLRAASIFGPTFSDVGVAVVASALLDEVRPRLAAFEAQELILRSLVHAAPHRTYSFRHALTHEAAYATLTDDDRARGHLAAAEWLESQQAPDHAAIATHFLHGNASARARRWFLRAAEHAAELGNFGDARRSADRCVELGAVGPDLGLARLVLAEVAAWSGSPGECFDHAQTAASLLPDGSTPYFRALALGLQSATLSNDLADVRTRFRDALHLEPSPGGEAGWIRFLCEAALTATVVDHTTESAAIMDRLHRAIAGRPLPDAAAAAILKTRCAIHLYAWDIEDNLALARDAVDRFTASGNLRGALWSQLTIGQTLQIVGAHSEAEAIIRPVGAVADKLDAALLQVFQLTRLGTLCLQTGRLDEAVVHLQRSLHIAEERRNSRGIGASRTALAWYWLESGDPELAESQARSAVAHLGIQRAFLGAAHGFLCRSLLAQGRLDEADALADDLDHHGAAIDFEAEHLQTIVAVRFAARGHDAGTAALQRCMHRLDWLCSRLRTPALRHSFLAQRPVHELLALAMRGDLDTATLVP